MLSKTPQRGRQGRRAQALQQTPSVKRGQPAAPLPRHIADFRARPDGRFWFFLAQHKGNASQLSDALRDALMHTAIVTLGDLRRWLPDRKLAEAVWQEFYRWSL